jgi:hypothetical protein
MELLLYLCFVFSGVFSSEYLPTAVFVTEIDKLFDSFNSVKRVAPGKTLLCPLHDSSPHVGHWTNAAMGVKSWIFQKDGKPAFSKPTPSQNGWLIDICASELVWRTLKGAGFDYLETRCLNEDPLENTFGVICLHCGSNNNPTVGQFVDALKTSIINGLAYTGLHDANCEGDDTELLDNYNASSRNLMLLHQIHPQFTVWTFFTMVLVAVILCSRRQMMTSISSQ